MAKPSIEDTIIRHQVFLEQLKTKEATDFAAVLKKTDREINKIIASLGEPDISKLNKKTLNALLRRLRKSQQELLYANEVKFFVRLEDLAEFEVGFEERVIKANVKKALRKKVNPGTPEAAFKAALGKPLSANGQLLKSFVREYSDKQIAAVNNAVRQAWVNGRTTGQLTRTLRGTRENGFTDGILNASTRHAKAIARTSLQHVSSRSRELVWERNKDIVEKYMYRATLDSRTTDICASLDGQIFEFNKGGPQPPMHIQCRSTTLPVLSKEFEVLKKGATRAAKGGPVKKSLTYYGWLKTQPEKFQTKVIGVERTKLLRSNKMSAERFAELQLNRNAGFTPRTLFQMRKDESALFAELDIKVRAPNK